MRRSGGWEGASGIVGFFVEDAGVDDDGGCFGTGSMFLLRRVTTCGMVVGVASVVEKYPSSPVSGLRMRDHVWIGK